MLKLTPKQQKFCEEYMIDLNATQAAIRAGYSSKGANVTASQLLTKSNISTRVQELKAKRAAKTEITADYVLTGFKEVAERCLQRIPVMEWDSVNKQMVQATDEEGKAIWQFDSGGANKAFEMLGKHIGIFEKDNTQKEINIVITGRKLPGQ